MEISRPRTASNSLHHCRFFLFLFRLALLHDGPDGAARCIELALSGLGKLQLTRGLLVAQALVSAQIAADEHRAGRGQEKDQRSRPMRHAAHDSPAPQAADRGDEKQQTEEPANND